MKIALIGFALGGLAIGLASRPALAATSTASFSVTATVVSGCQASAGAYTAARVAPSSVSVNCTSPTAYNVSLSAGRSVDSAATTAAESTPKIAGSASELLGHGLQPDLTRANNWARTAGRSNMAGLGAGYFQQYAVQGQTAGAKNFAPSPYADLITITVTY